MTAQVSSMYHTGMSLFLL